jgi:hypothetical protein
VVPRAAALLFTLVCAAFGIAYLTKFVPLWLSVNMVGVDFSMYQTAAIRWLGGGNFYLDYQLAGPYATSGHVGLDSPILYPPTLLLLLVPFTVLPAILWWVIPILITALTVAAWRPRPLVWPVLAFLLVFPMTLWEIATGNPVLWFTMLFALGTRYGWPSALIVLKPTLAPFALLGMRRRSWWLALACLAAVSLLFLSTWPDYIRATLNLTADLGLLYSLNQFPMMMIPVIAWLGRGSAGTARPREA